MAALLFDFATNPGCRTAVKRQFDSIESLFSEYQGALKKVYPSPRPRSALTLPLMGYTHYWSRPQTIPDDLWDNIRAAREKARGR